MWIGRELAGNRSPVLGRYRLLTELARGNMADVYLAANVGPLDSGRLVVLKRLRSVEDPQHRSMFLDEARLSRRLSHRNIVQTFEVGQEEGTHFIVMEYLAGPTLRALRRSVSGPLPWPIEVQILSHVLDGLHYAHELASPEGRPLHIVHRDLCAENVLVAGSGDCKILDFGVAKVVDSISLTQSGFFKGKLRNMPPEQLLGKQIDRRTDIFSAGVMLWEGLSGRSLWGDLGDAGIAVRLAQGELPALGELPAGVPVELRAIAVRALSADPAARFPDALAFKGALSACLEQHHRAVGRQEVAAFVQPVFARERERILQILDQLRAGAPPAPAPTAVTVASAPVSRRPTARQVAIAAGGALLLSAAAAAIFSPPARERGSPTVHPAQAPPAARAGLPGAGPPGKLPPQPDDDPRLSPPRAGRKRASALRKVAPGAGAATRQAPRRPERAPGGRPAAIDLTDLDRENPYGAAPRPLPPGPEGRTIDQEAPWPNRGRGN
jgi:eukaryotic-like serine/threonine-protein kinase